MNYLIDLLNQSIHRPETLSLFKQHEQIDSQEIVVEQADQGETLWVLLHDYGLELECDASGLIKTIFIYGISTEDVIQYSGNLIPGLTFESRPSDVKAIFGEPSKHGKPQPLLKFGRSGGWDRYDWEHCCLHFQYADDGRGINLITLMSPDVAP